MEERTKSFDALVDFRRRTPLSELDEARLAEFVESLQLDKDGYDIGRRKEARILSFAGGQMILQEDGTAHVRLKGWPWGKAATVVTAFIRQLCTVYNWDADVEVFQLYLDVDLEVDFPDATSSAHLENAIKADWLSRLTPEGETARAAGLKLFLSDLGSRDEDVRLRVEPLAAEPHSKAFVNVTGLFSNTSVAQANQCVERLEKIAAATQLTLKNQGS
ncbi:MAG: hypothetical protein V1790_02555 [Planctomycetota bacterium]